MGCRPSRMPSPIGLEARSRRPMRPLEAVSHVAFQSAFVDLEVGAGRVRLLIQVVPAGTGGPQAPELLTSTALPGSG